ncbi:methylthioadenosine phosphorylase [Desulfonispora thiosulfatigenes DSM 11270]|uniref:Probable 6-oxopurine nucleoside phosphorylase n=1 Tax=Desulfonispora thiosulfatigenes DSM 11270 TaxID=656914 RepID=A0A1W1VJV7_DESTI|nr:S-methyl-5'-thioadenosine phosphorylase [Desulfonispora thiosulfatigenes]SMB93657.1 methylthioadenosine phosphorylase [Desulfonispora thiosulfatigenes DSM 11270]
MKIDFAVIGGTGVYNPKMLTNLKIVDEDTPYGKVSITIGEVFSKKVAFLARHGQGHSVPPHLINYRANIYALKNLGVKKIIATAAVGSLREDLRPGDFVLLDQFIDFTKNREQTFYEGGEKGVLHLDMTNPYCPETRNLIAQVCPKDITLHPKGNYICTEGPRFETPAEIKMFSLWNADVVGMTSVPEVVLAKELGMCYASIAMVTNFAAGISQNELTHAEVTETMAQNKEKLQDLLMVVLENIAEKQNCVCPLATKELGNLGKEE